MSRLVGNFRLGADAATRSGTNGNFVSLRLAFDAYNGKENITQWVDATWAGSRAEKMAEHLKSGSLIDAVIKDVYIDTFQRTDGSQGVTLRGRIADADFVGGRRPDAATKEAAKETATSEG